MPRTAERIQIAVEPHEWHKIENHHAEVQRDVDQQHGVVTERRALHEREGHGKRVHGRLHPNAGGRNNRSMPLVGQPPGIGHVGESGRLQIENHESHAADRGAAESAGDGVAELVDNGCRKHERDEQGQLPGAARDRRQSLLEVFDLKQADTRCRAERRDQDTRENQNGIAENAFQASHGVEYAPRAGNRNTKLPEGGPLERSTLDRLCAFVRQRGLDRLGAEENQPGPLHARK